MKRIKPKTDENVRACVRVQTVYSYSISLSQVQNDALIQTRIF